jgi:FkbM family methyltransferase
MAADSRSLVRYSADLLFSRIRRWSHRPPSAKERRIRLKGGVTLAYRPQGGDLWSIREIWLCESYRLPSFAPSPAIVIDLGANIGTTSVWLAKRHGCRQLIAVEPSVSNAALVRVNFALNRTPGTVIEAAVAPFDGEARFEENSMSNLGRLGEHGRPVRAVSMTTVMKELPGDTEVDLLKLDIEGGEQALLTGGELPWLRRVRSIIAEFHPRLVDYAGLIRILQNSGFTYYPAGTCHPDSMDFFLRSK